MTRAARTPRVVPVDVESLERRARELAAGIAADDVRSAGVISLVGFSLRARRCALDSAIVERAVVLAAPLGVPALDGSERVVAFVDERPLEIVDLDGLAAGTPRGLDELAGAPALVVATPSGPVAVAVGGPLELVEDRVVATSEAVGDPGPIRVAGRLAGGAALIDAGWLAAWAGNGAAQ